MAAFNIGHLLLLLALIGLIFLVSGRCKLTCGDENMMVSIGPTKVKDVFGDEYKSQDMEALTMLSTDPNIPNPTMAQFASQDMEVPGVYADPPMVDYN